VSPSADWKPAGGLASVAAAIAQLRRERAVVSGLAALWKVNQPGGFDCPGCAWPEPSVRSVFEFCENGAKHVAAEATTRRADPAFFAANPIPELRGRSDRWLEERGRLTHPMIRRRGADRYEPLPWAEAFAIAGARLRALPHPDRAVFYTSGRTSNEAAYLYQLLGRMLGTNNFPDCSNMCHESSGVALGQVIGAGKGTVQLADFDQAEAIFIVGQNPGTNHPRMLQTLLEARRRGAAIVAINPLRERGLVSFTHPKEIFAALTGRGTEIATVYLQLKVGSDVALLKGIMKHVIEAERRQPGRVLDHAFLSEHTTGFEQLVADLDATTWEAIERETGLARTAIQAASDVYVRARSTIICWAMGLTQQQNAVDNVMACANLAMLRGNLGRSGAGLCPVRGHSNVQGDRTVGINHAPSTEFLDALERTFGFTPPRSPGHDVVSALRAMGAGEVDALVALGGNLAAAAPDSEATFAALGRVPFTVQIATRLNRSHVVVGAEAMIWPALARSEIDRQASGTQVVTVEDSMSCVHASGGTNAPASPELMSEPAIVAGLAKAALDGPASVDWDGLVADYGRIRALIERTIPGFDRYNERIRSRDGFALPHPAARRQWRTRSGRAELRVVPTPRIVLRPGELRLFTIRSHDQYNTTVYGDDDRYRGIKGRRNVVFVNPEDVSERGLSAGDRVDITAVGADGRARVARGFEVVPYDVPRECVAAYFPETNVLVPLAHASRESNQPVSKMVPVTIARAAKES
jgi:molybdopterin-dependent oxidoreductase alpha subunit